MSEFGESEVTVGNGGKPNSPDPKGKGLLKPYRSAAFVLIFALIGAYLIVNSFAATVTQNKVWNNAATWNTGTLAGAVVSGNSVRLATNNTASQTSSGTVVVSTPTPANTAVPSAPASTPTVLPSTNLAHNRPARASSVDSKSRPARLAFDGNPRTRWSSAYRDYSWVYVDLGKAYNIGRVRLSWDPAYGKAYQIKVSNDAKSWTTFYSTTNGHGKVENLKGLKGSGRYVAMQGIKRGSHWGYSLWEMSIYGSSITVPTTSPAATGYTLNVAKPVTGQTAAGVVTFSGTETNLKNVEVWYGNTNVSAATIGANGSWSAAVDTSKQPNGSQTYTVYGWDITAGKQAAHTLTKDIALNVDNSVSTSQVTYSSTGSITLSFDAGSSVGWKSLTPQTDLPMGTSATYKARTSNDNKNWSTWSSDIGNLNSSRYIQVQAVLSTTVPTSTPVLNGLTLSYDTVVSSPTVALKASPTTIVSGQSTTLTWSSANATSCTANGAWAGNKAVSGSSLVSITQVGSLTFGLSCTGSGGTANASTTVAVASPPSTGGGSTGGSSSGGCTASGVVAPCIGGPTTGASGWGAPVFDDEFNGSNIDRSRWSNSWFGGGEMNGVNTSSSNVSVSGGNLLLTLSSSSLGALVDTNPNSCGCAGFQFGTGYYAEASVYFPGNGGDIYNWPAWWTNGQSWPATGEIDIAEGLGPLTSNYHYLANGEHVADNSNAIPGIWSNGFHIYGVDRQNGNNKIYWDGNLIRSYSTHDNGAPQYLIFNIGGSGHTGSAYRLKVDYARVWKKL